MNNLLTNLLFQYGVALIILWIAEVLYFKVALHFDIIDKPNERSSHSVPTIRGGGVIFVLATCLFYFWSGFSFPFVLISVVLSGSVSFIDDMRTVNNKIKFLAHVLSVALILVQCGMFTTLPIFYLIGLGILIIGIVNAYNFMDGINGITGLYTIAVLLPLFLSESDDQLQLLEMFLLVGLLVFNFYNARNKARCFAGDVGSISLAILVVFLLIKRIQITHQIEYVGFLLVYGIDSVFTILQRLYEKENIFLPHRKHLYQYYCNEKKTPHLWVSGIYASMQFLIGFCIVQDMLHATGLVLLAFSLSVFYWMLKIPLIKHSVKNI